MSQRILQPKVSQQFLNFTIFSAKTQLLILDKIHYTNINSAIKYTGKKRNNYIEKPNVGSFDSYVLRSPEEKTQKSAYSTKNQEFNTIDSKFRSVEKINKKKLLQTDLKEQRNQLLKSIDSKAYSNIRIKNLKGTEASFTKIRQEENLKMK